MWHGNRSFLILLRSAFLFVLITNACRCEPEEVLERVTTRAIATEPLDQLIESQLESLTNDTTYNVSGSRTDLTSKQSSSELGTDTDADTDSSSHEEIEYIDDGDDKSDVSEEENEADRESPLPNSSINLPIIRSHIDDFFDSGAFRCPRVKTDLQTGTSVGDLSPEDIKFIAALGDGITSGIGLFERRMDVEFRGASFASGGDANFDGLVSIPNILLQFSPSLQGVSHGMGAVETLPSQQLSVARKGATTKDLPGQARDLITRLESYNVDFRNQWVMIIIGTGTEEMCTTCGPPNEDGIRAALAYLYSSLNKAFVVLLGPTHVSHTNRQAKNLLKYRCECSKDKPPGFMESVAASWHKVFYNLQTHYDQLLLTRPTFALLAMPALTVASRNPDTLFHHNSWILNRKGHTYMSKWLWNRLMTGSDYNLSSSVLSSDAYYCPSSGCPYFRTTANMRRCEMLSIADAKENKLTLGDLGVVLKQKRRTQRTLYSIAIAVVIIAFFVALIMGVLFYQISKRSLTGRFEEVNESPAVEAPPRSPELIGKAPLLRQNAFNKSGRYLEVPSPTFGAPAITAGSSSDSSTPVHRMPDLGSERDQLLGE